MDFSLILLGALLTVLVVSMISRKKIQVDEKKDKGFVLSYHKLSYRRRMIRSLWLIPISAFVYFAVYQSDIFSSGELTFLGLVFLFVGIYQITREYENWKRNEKKG